jgi:acyl-coenzyme A synthetase/AMP-(fatty) acid ligase/acyl carrier protein
LLSGRTLIPIPQAVRADASAFVRFVSKQQLDAVDCTPSQLRAWLEAGLLNGHGHALRLVLIGGEPIDARLWDRLARCSTTAFYNVYGPTEITVDATFACINGDSTQPHIGRPLQNRRVYILDRTARPVSIGSPGELYIGGAGVARGYLKRPLLTAERFVMDPSDAADGARMYKSGDLARWRQDGTIEYLGRNDDQIKIRGFRVELGEIEAQLSSLDQVEQAIVVAREDILHQKRLVAYVVPKHAANAASADALRTQLEASLPPYMVPSAFVTMTELPLSANGKVDRDALPAPQASAYRSRAFEAPSGELEQAISTIWQELLGVERPGRHDHFLELGGDSLTATQVGTRIQAQLSIDIAVSAVFEFPILRELAEQVAEMRQASWQERIAAVGDGDMEELLSSVAALPENEVRRLLDELIAEAN